MRKTIIYTLFPKKQDFFTKKCVFPADIPQKTIFLVLMDRLSAGICRIHKSGPNPRHLFSFSTSTFHDGHTSFVSSFRHMHYLSVIMQFLSNPYGMISSFLDFTQKWCIFCSRQTVIIKSCCHQTANLCFRKRKRTFFEK